MSGAAAGGTLGAVTTTAPLDDEQNRAAAERVRERTGQRAANMRVLREPLGIAKADSPERVAKRMDRLASYHLGEPMPVGRASAVAAAGEPEALMRAAARRVADSDKVPAIAGEGEDPDRVLERIINNADFLEFRYLDAGSVAGRAVGRIVMRGANGRDRRLRHRLARLAAPAADQPPRAARPRRPRRQRRRVRLPVRPRPRAAAPAAVRLRPGRVLRRRQGARLRARRGRRHRGAARAVRLQPAHQRGGQGHRRRARHDRPAPRRAR